MSALLAWSTRACSRPEVSVEIKIGVVESARELLVNSDLSPDEVEALVADAFAGKQSVLTLVDDKGRRFVIPSTRISYVEIGASDARKVGFA
ncbi:ATP-binding protein [Kutzneria sp. 744]|nr:ATP-binding protein [Kutzneria sp. 744]